MNLPWFIDDNIGERVDSIIVLSYAAKDHQNPTRMTKSAIKKALTLWEKFPKSKIIMSTGNNQRMGISNAKIMADYAIRKGADPKNIILEDKSMDTFENLLFTKEILKKNNLNYPAIVALDLHMARALATARKLNFKNLSWVSAYSKGDLAPDLRHSQTLSRPTIFIYEVFAYLYFKIRGWI